MSAFVAGVGEGVADAKVVGGFPSSSMTTSGSGALRFCPTLLFTGVITSKRPERQATQGRAFVFWVIIVFLFSFPCGVFSTYFFTFSVGFGVAVGAGVGVSTGRGVAVGAGSGAAPFHTYPY